MAPPPFNVDVWIRTIVELLEENSKPHYQSFGLITETVGNTLTYFH